MGFAKKRSGFRWDRVEFHFLAALSILVVAKGLNAEEVFLTSTEISRRPGSESVANEITPYSVRLSDLPKLDSGEDEGVIAASMLQRMPLIETEINLEIGSSLLEPRSPSTSPQDSVQNRRTKLPRYFGELDRVQGREAFQNSATDVGDLLGKASTAFSIAVQNRTPIIHDARIRGSRIGALAATGSHWVPARVDLDTIMSKFDSRQIESVTITPGPYTSLLGPSFSFADVQMLRSPRYENGFESHGRTGGEYQSNGNQVFGQQSVNFGSTNWGGRFDYVFRDGGDYQAGGGTVIPSSYRSNEMTLALGRDWENDSIEISALRLDQTDVIFPGYVFDIDNLVTDGYEVTHTRKELQSWDRVTTDVWYNRTRFDGNAQNPRKREFFPVLNALFYTGFTDVDSMSTGYRQIFSLGGGPSDVFQLSVGHDFRFIRQELNEVSNGVTIGFPVPFVNRNSPIPESFQANPGIFIEYKEEIGESTLARIGGRVDYAATDITDDAAKLAAVGLDDTPANYSEIMGTNRFDRSFTMLSAFASLKRELSDETSGSMGLGYAERPPNLTELYAAQPYMLVLQNGLNNVTGDPTLKDEKLLQFDLGWEYHDKPLRTGIRGFHAWAFDYITFESTSKINNQLVDQVSLRYVNTNLATMAGFETFGELNPDETITPFFNTRFVDGRDRTRNGRFATSEGSSGAPSTKDFTKRRGANSSIIGGDEEPLPGIAPFETRIGLRFHDTDPEKRWLLEISSRMVDRQNRIAKSLLETPTSGFTVWDIRSTFRPAFSKNMLITMGIENMLDRRYREHLDFRTRNGLSVFQPGANFYFGMNLAY